MENNTKNLPAEYVPLVEMTQKEESIKKGISSMKQKILASAGEEFLSWKEEKQDKILERTVMAIAKNEKLIKCFESTMGKISIIHAIEKSVSTGLEIDGKHAYLIPQGRKSGKKDAKKQDIWVTEARYSIRDRGYYALLCGGKRPIFLDLRWSTVYEKDDCSVDAGTGIVSHKKHIGEDRGKFIGCWVQCKKMNNQLEVEFFPVSKIHQWRDSSKAYKSGDSPWEQWPEEMSLQSCIRHFCDKYETARELLAAAIYDENGTTEPEKKSSVDSVNEALNKKEPKPEEEEPEEKQDTENQEEKVDDPELF